MTRATKAEHKVSKEEFDSVAEGLRTELLQLQDQLKSQDFPVVLLFAGAAVAGSPCPGNAQPRLNRAKAVQGAMQSHQRPYVVPLRCRVTCASGPLAGLSKAPRYRRRRFASKTTRTNAQSIRYSANAVEGREDTMSAKQLKLALCATVFLMAFRARGRRHAIRDRLHPWRRHRRRRSRGRCLGDRGDQ